MNVSESVTDFALRDARPEDADFLALVIRMASLGRGSTSIWDLALGFGEVAQGHILRDLVLAEPPSAAHFNGFVVAEAHSSPIAAACGYLPSEKSPELFTEALLTITERLGWLEQQQLKLIQSFEVFSRCLPMTRGEDWVLEYIATLPQYRGSGVTQELLEDLLDCGREAGAKIARVAYFVGNDPAKKLYRRLGFVETHESLDSEFQELFGAPGVVHMMRRL